MLTTLREYYTTEGCDARTSELMGALLDQYKCDGRDSNTEELSKFCSSCVVLYTGVRLIRGS